MVWQKKKKAVKKLDSERKIPKMTDRQIDLLYEGLKKHGRDFSAILEDEEFCELFKYDATYLANKYSRMVTLKDSRFVEIREEHLSKSRSSLGGAGDSPVRLSLSGRMKSNAGSSSNHELPHQKQSKQIQLKRTFEAISMSDVHVCGQYARFNVQLSNGKHSWIRKEELVTEDRDALHLLIMTLEVKLNVAREELDRLERGENLLILEEPPSPKKRRRRAIKSLVESVEEAVESEQDGELSIDGIISDSQIESSPKSESYSTENEEQEATANEEQEEVARIVKLQDQNCAKDQNRLKDHNRLKDQNGLKDQNNLNDQKRTIESTPPKTNHTEEASDIWDTYSKRIARTIEMYLEVKSDETLDLDVDEELPTPEECLGDMFMTQAKETQILPSMVQESDIKISLPIRITPIDKEVLPENTQPKSADEELSSDRKMKIVKSLEAVRDDPNVTDRCRVM